MIQTQYTKIKIVDVSKVDMKNGREVLSAVNLIQHNRANYFLPKSKDAMKSIAELSYLIGGFDRVGNKFTVTAVCNMFNVRCQIYYLIERIWQYSKGDLQFLINTCLVNNITSYRKLHNHLTIEAAKVGNEIERHKLSAPIVKEQKMREFSSRVPSFARKTIQLLENLHTNWGAWNAQKYYLMKMQRYLNWYLPEIEPIDANDYFQFGMCACCGKLNESDVPYEMRTFEFKAYHKGSIDVACCSKCKTGHKIKEEHLLIIMINYANKLEKIIDGKNTDFKKGETYSKHFYKPYRLEQSNTEYKR